MKKKLAIIGAGIAGLTFANLIKKNSDFEFMVYEKKETLSLEKGFGIQLSINSILILNKIGFKNIKPEEINHPEKLNFYSINSDKICDLDLTRFNTKEIKYTTLQRATLLEFLKDEIYNQHLRFGKKIQRVSEINNKILINFDDGTNDLVDYVIAADGIFSNTKSFFESNINRPKFKNAIAVRSILKLKKIQNMDVKNINLFMGANTHLAVYPINKNDLNLICIVRHKKFDPDNIRNLIDKKVLNQGPILKKLFEGDLNSWPLYSTDKILPSSNKNVFYLGDAFQSFLPTMAQGAAQSIEGAYTLFNLLKDKNNNAHNIYFETRSKRAKLIKKRSNFNFFAFHVSNPVIKVIRNIILKYVIKNKAFISNYLGKVYNN